MDNAILYFFGINSLNLEKINNNYYFKYQNRDYIVFLYDRDPNEVVEIYYLNLELLRNGLIGYEIILTRNKEVLFIYEDKYYVLMKIPNIKNRTITYKDIIDFRYRPEVKINYLDKSNWSYNWSNKIDFIEYQFNQFKNKYKIVDNSIDYFIGIWENGISYFNDNFNFNKEKVITHKRVTTDMDLLSFLNPFNFVIDYIERDIGDYLKSYAFNNNYWSGTINNFLKGFDKESIILIISRMLFPSYYFDVYENIIIEKESEKNLDEVLSKKDNVLKIIAFIFKNYEYYNIPSISWIKKEIS